MGWSSLYTRPTMIRAVGVAVQEVDDHLLPDARNEVPAPALAAQGCDTRTQQVDFSLLSS
jgi:hypothetical protein